VLLDAAQSATEQWAEQNLPPEVIAQLAALSQRDWQAFWNATLNSLHGAVVEDLARRRPQIQTAITYLDLAYGNTEYSDWLRQRLDYFEVADETVRAIPAPPPKPAPPAPPKPVPPPAPPTPPTPKPTVSPPPIAPVAPDIVVRKQRAARLRSPRVWGAKLGARPVPRRAPALVPQLKSAFRAEGVPQELVWIAEVESSMNPRARSPAGAVGLFQFMPATARRFGLRTGDVDDRYDPVQSARAAAKYLRVLHRQFGSWPLALAAYNAGEGCVQKRLKRSPTKTFDAIAEDLPMETQMYVPKVLAVVALREGVDANALPPPALAGIGGHGGPPPRSLAPSPVGAGLCARSFADVAAQVKEEWPPMHADAHRWISVWVLHRRSSACIGGSPSGA
jgi:membrane-bound lytic murein transglycosylase D